MLKGYVIILKLGYLVYEACELVCKCVIMLNAWFVMSSHFKCVVCYVLIQSYSVERLCYYVKMWVSLSMKHVNLFIQSVLMLNRCAVLSTQYLIMFKGYVIMGKSFVI